MLKCVDCGTENKSDAKFCVSCGSVLVLACNDCGHHNPIKMKFCQGCGAKITPALVFESEHQDPASAQLQQEVTHQTALIPASAEQSEVSSVVHAGVGGRNLNSSAPEPCTSPSQNSKFNFKWLLVGSAVVFLIGISGAGLFYINHSQPSVSKPEAITASQFATIPPTTLVPAVVTTTLEPTPIATPNVTASPTATIVATVEPTAIPIALPNPVKTTAKPKPRFTPKPTPLKQFIHVEHEVLPTEAATPAVSGFTEKFAACARLDFLNKAACEVKLCFSKPSAQECKREPSVQDRQRR